jgi:hypothetical protein
MEHDLAKDPASPKLLGIWKNYMTYLVELFLQGSDDLSMDDNIVIFQCVYEFIENSNRFL